MSKLTIGCGTASIDIEPSQADLDDAVREAADDFMTAVSEFGIGIPDELEDSLFTLIAALNAANHIEEE